MVHWKLTLSFLAVLVLTAFAAIDGGLHWDLLGV